MIVLGYNGFTHSRDSDLMYPGPDKIDHYAVVGHDAGAAVIIDGRVVAAVEEERLNREKKTSQFPSNAINWCLAKAGISLSDVDYFALPWAFTSEVLGSMKSEVAEFVPDPAFRSMVFAELDKLYERLFDPEQVANDFYARTGYKIPAGKLILVPHHMAHLMCGYQVRGGGDTAFFISDGRGEKDSSLSGQIENGEITIFEHLTVGSGNSIGLFYSEITRYLGFYPNNDEYKVMGLSAYCPSPTDPRIVDSLITLLDDGQISFPIPLTSPGGHVAYESLLDGIFGADDSIRDSIEFKARVARAAQDVLELATAHQITALSKCTSLSNLIHEGGVALNCVNNTKVLEAADFSSVHVSFGASDTGLPIGAAAYVGHVYGNVTPVPCTTYLGPEYTHEEMLQATRLFEDRLVVTELNEADVAAKTADLLTEKVVIGWFQGCAEYGPRALGSRSILANPTFDDIKDTINLRVKHREPFRPFAPVVLESEAGKLFEMGKLSASPHMTFVVPVREEFRGQIPGASHVDGTSRVQTVGDDQNPLLAELLREVQKRIGVGCLINTSFNVAGEPIVGSPEDAIRCFLSTEIDYLVLGKLLIRKAERK